MFVLYKNDANLPIMQWILFSKTFSAVTMGMSEFHMVKVDFKRIVKLTLMFAHRKGIL